MEVLERGTAHKQRVWDEPQPLPRLRRLLHLRRVQIGLAQRSEQRPHRDKRAADLHDPELGHAAQPPAEPHEVLVDHGEGRRGTVAAREVEREHLQLGELAARLSTESGEVEAQHLVGLDAENHEPRRLEVREGVLCSSVSVFVDHDNLEQVREEDAPGGRRGVQVAGYPERAKLEPDQSRCRPEEHISELAGAGPRHRTKAGP